MEANLVMGKETQEIKGKKIKIKIWHLPRALHYGPSRLSATKKVFNHEQWHESKVKHRIWDELIIYAKVTWDRVIK